MLSVYYFQDLLLLRENVNTNRDQISKPADLVNISMAALNQQYTKPSDITSPKETLSTHESIQLTDHKKDIRLLQSDMKRARRSIYEEKLYARQVYVQLNDAINNMQTNVLLNQNETQAQIITSGK